MKWHVQNHATEKHKGKVVKQYDTEKMNGSFKNHARLTWGITDDYHSSLINLLATVK